MTKADLLGNNTAITNPSKRTMVIFIRAVRPGAPKRETTRNHITLLPNSILPSGLTIMLNIRNINASCLLLIDTLNAYGGKHNYSVLISERQSEINLARLARRAYIWVYLYTLEINKSALMWPLSNSVTRLRAYFDIYKTMDRKSCV